MYLMLLKLGYEMGYICKGNKTITLSKYFVIRYTLEDDEIFAEQTEFRTFY